MNEIQRLHSLQRHLLEVDRRVAHVDRKLVELQNTRDALDGAAGGPTPSLVPYSSKGFAFGSLDLQRPVMTMIGMDMFVECSAADTQLILDRRADGFAGAKARLAEERARCTEQLDLLPARPRISASTLPGAASLPIRDGMGLGSDSPNVVEEGGEPLVDIVEPYVSESDDDDDDDDDVSGDTRGSTKAKRAKRAGVGSSQGSVPESSKRGGGGGLPPSLQARLDELEQLEAAEAARSASKHADARARIELLRVERNEADEARRKRQNQKQRVPTAGARRAAPVEAPLAGDVVERLGHVSLRSAGSPGSSADGHEKKRRKHPQSSVSAGELAGAVQQDYDQGVPGPGDASSPVAAPKRPPSKFRREQQQQQQQQRRNPAPRSASSKSSIEREMIARLRK